MEIIPDISVCHLGAYRDHETLKAHVYLDKVPPLTPADQVFLVDPMLATGNSAIAALDIVRAKGGENITLVNVLAAPEGVEAIKAYSGKVNLVLGAMDRELNDKGYILPGLGDAGDRAFNTQ